MRTTKMNNICVFAGAAQSGNSAYTQAACQLGGALVSKNLGLVYGGANIGLMAELANSVLSLNGTAVGVIPKALLHHEIAHQHLTHLHIVDSMHDRKRLMDELADGFIAFPGGLGTLEETFEIWNAIKMGLCKKPLGLLNINGYFNELLNFLNHAIREEFIKKDHLKMIIIGDNPLTLVEQVSELMLHEIS